MTSERPIVADVGSQPTGDGPRGVPRVDDRRVLRAAQLNARPNPWLTALQGRAHVNVAAAAPLTITLGTAAQRRNIFRYPASPCRHLMA